MNESPIEEVPVTKHEESIFGHNQKNGMNHMTEKDKKENKSAANNFRRPRNKQRPRDVSLKNEKGIVHSIFEQNKSKTSERSVAFSNTARAPGKVYSFFQTPLTYWCYELDLSNYSNRLSTFSDWPRSVGVRAKKLAKAGFYYVLKGTTVECFACGLSVSDWLPEHDPRTRHKELAPLCVFINPSTTASATEGSEHFLDIQALNREINTNAISKPQENVHQPSSPENAAINFEKLINKILKCSFDTTVINTDTSEKHQNHERNGMGTQKDDYTSGRGLPINRPVDGTSSKETGNVCLCPPTNNSYQNIPESSILQESERNHNVSENDYNQLVNFAIAKHPQYANPKRRLETFRSWLYHNVQHPQRLVEAGFYYTGSTDVVRCFHCDIGLAEWDVQDDPWVEHARHSPQCFFLREKKRHGIC